MAKKSYLTFNEVLDTGKTKVWEVHNFAGILLGNISWRNGWRRYVWHQDTSLLELDFDADCLDDISAFIRERMQERKNV